MYVIKAFNVWFFNWYIIEEDVSIGQEDFWKKGALKNSFSVNLPASSVFKILENYLRRT